MEAIIDVAVLALVAVAAVAHIRQNAREEKQKPLVETAGDSGTSASGKECRPSEEMAAPPVAPPSIKYRILILILWALSAVPRSLYLNICTLLRLAACYWTTSNAYQHKQPLPKKTSINSTNQASQNTHHPVAPQPGYQKAFSSRTGIAPPTHYSLNAHISSPGAVPYYSLVSAGSSYIPNRDEGTISRVASHPAPHTSTSKDSSTYNPSPLHQAHLCESGRAHTFNRLIGRLDRPEIPSQSTSQMRSQTPEWAASYCESPAMKVASKSTDASSIRQTPPNAPFQAPQPAPSQANTKPSTSVDTAYTITPPSYEAGSIQHTPPSAPLPATQPTVDHATTKQHTTVNAELTVASVSSNPESIQVTPSKAPLPVAEPAVDEAATTAQPILHAARTHKPEAKATSPPKTQMKTSTGRHPNKFAGLKKKLSPTPSPQKLRLLDRGRKLNKMRLEAMNRPRLHPSVKRSREVAEISNSDNGPQPKRMRAEPAEVPQKKVRKRSRVQLRKQQERQRRLANRHTGGDLQFDFDLVFQACMNINSEHSKDTTTHEYIPMLCSADEVRGLMEISDEETDEPMSDIDNDESMPEGIELAKYSELHEEHMGDGTLAGEIAAQHQMFMQSSSPERGYNPYTRSSRFREPPSPTMEVQYDGDDESMSPLRCSFNYIDIHSSSSDVVIREPCSPPPSATGLFSEEDEDMTEETPTPTRTYVPSHHEIVPLKSILKNPLTTRLDDNAPLPELLHDSEEQNIDGKGMQRARAVWGIAPQPLADGLNGESQAPLHDDFAYKRPRLTFDNEPNSSYESSNDGPSTPCDNPEQAALMASIFDYDSEDDMPDIGACKLDDAVENVAGTEDSGEESEEVEIIVAGHWDITRSEDNSDVEDEDPGKNEEEQQIGDHSDAADRPKASEAETDSFLSDVMDRIHKQNDDELAEGLSKALSFF